VAEVYKATHVETNRSVALKTLRPFFAADPYIIEHMMAEAELLSKLRHPNVVHVEASGVEKGVLWMAMEYVPGITLRALLRSLGALSARRALYYAKEIADGVAAAHAMGVVHRDLKPENVMITRQHEVKVLDMGAAKFYGWDIKRTVRGAIFGTPLYMSPEHIREEPMDVRSDVYSLGLILYEMLAGRHPFAQPKRGALSKHEVCELQIHVDPTPLADLLRGFPADLSNFVQRAIAKDRKKRPSSMLEFAQEARGFLVTLGTEDHDVPWLRRVPASQRMRGPALGATPDDDGPWDSAAQSEGQRRGRTSGAVRRSGGAPIFLLRDSQIDNEDKSTLVFTRLHGRSSAEVEVALDEDDLIQEEIERNSILVEFEDDDPQGDAQTTAIASEAAPKADPGLRSGFLENAITRRFESLPDGAAPSREAVLPCAPGTIPDAPMSAPAMSAAHSLRAFETDRVATLALDRELAVSGIRKAPAPRRRTKSRAVVTVLFAGALAAAMPLAYSRLSASAATNEGTWASSAPSEPAPTKTAQEQEPAQAIAPQPAPAPPVAVGSPEAPVKAAPSDAGAKKPAASRRRAWGASAPAWSPRRARFEGARFEGARASSSSRDADAKDAKDAKDVKDAKASLASPPASPAQMIAPVAAPAPTAMPPSPPPPSKRYSPTEI
jgi:serine/threonine-protein kinase